MSRKSTPFLFVDSNVLIEHLFVPPSAASVVVDLVAQGVFRMITCEQVIRDIESAIDRKFKKSPERLNRITQQWKDVLVETKLTILVDPDPVAVDEVSLSYLPLMRHKADIPILAAAISAQPYAILSGNREHFNDAIAQKCGIKIYSCSEFIKLFAQAKV